MINIAKKVEANKKESVLFCKTSLLARLGMVAIFTVNYAELL